MEAHAYNERIGVYVSNGRYVAVCVCGYACRPKVCAADAAAAVAEHVAKAAE